MSVPPWDQFMAPVLRLLLDGQVRNRRECHGLVADAMGLTEEQRTELLNSGHVKYRNRIGWAMSYLTRVGALDRPTRGNYSITNVGRQLLAQHPDGITESDLRLIARQGDEWWVPKRAEDPAVTPELPELSGLDRARPYGADRAGHRPNPC